MRQLFWSLTLWGCLLGQAAWAEVKHIDHKVHEVEAVEGRGPTVEDALKAAQAAAIDRVVKEALVDGEDGWRRFEAARPSILKDLADYAGGLAMTDKYREGDEIVVAMGGPVRKEALRQRLLALGVMQDLSQTLSAGQLPRLAVRAATGAADANTLVAVTAINNLLTERRLAVVDEGRRADLAREDRKLAGVAAAASAGQAADVELSLTSEVRPGQAFGDLQMYQASVAVEARIPGVPEPFAREVYQSREMGFKSSADHKKSQAACVEEAVGGALEPLMRRVTGELQAERTRGKTVALTVVGEARTLARADVLLQAHLMEVRSVDRPGGRLYVGRVATSLDGLVELLADDAALEVVGEPEQTARQARVQLRLRPTGSGR